MRRATVTNCLILLNQRFQSTLSVRRATRAVVKLHIAGQISIHALREESDIKLAMFYVYHLLISIHALREESDSSYIKCSKCNRISIHALREESDFIHQLFSPEKEISIHALREESDIKHQVISQIIATFQSTLSVRRATSG